MARGKRKSATSAPVITEAPAIIEKVAEEVDYKKERNVLIINTPSNLHASKASERKGFHKLVKIKCDDADCVIKRYHVSDDKMTITLSHSPRDVVFDIGLIKQFIDAEISSNGKRFTYTTDHPKGLIEVCLV